MLRLMILFCVFWMALCGPRSFGSPQGDQILIADFEQEGYGDWKVTGEAFGPGPATGTLPGQMQVDGYQGQGLVNSFYGGDDSEGEMISPPFRIQRDYINFLVGGGRHPDETCVQLLINGEVVRSTTGPNDRSGGSERLDWSFWDVGRWKGQQAEIRILDHRKGGWGHINVDHIYQSDHHVESRFIDADRNLTIDGSLLVIPIADGVAPQRIQLWSDDQMLHQFEANLATGEPDWWGYLDVSSLSGKTVTLKIQQMPTKSAGWTAIRTADSLPAAVSLYSEKLRPQLRFSQKRGWNNDPNGMVFLDGKYHFFWQSNPVGWNWNNMYWGHAVSDDLVTWTEKPHALKPYVMAEGMCFSGGGVVDHNNSGGWQRDNQSVMVLGFTDTGAGESLVISRDGGQQFEAIDQNPVVRHAGRDPKLVWYEYRESDEPWNKVAEDAGGHWVMAVYDEAPEAKQNISFYVSNDLKSWELASRSPGFYECPELFSLPIPGRPGELKWVLFAADAQYVIGQFDGRKFIADHEGKHRLHYGDFYASQCFANQPEQRVIQVGWARINMPGMPFNQAFSLPLDLTLRETENGIRMFANPVAELNSLRGEAEVIQNRQFGPEDLELPIPQQLMDIEMELEIGTAESIEIQFGKNRLILDVEKKRLGEIPVTLNDGRLKLRLVIDRPMYELVVDQGASYQTSPRNDGGEPLRQVRLSAGGGTAELRDWKAYPMRSIWEHHERP